MIVRDEEAVIERALRSAIPWISSYVIVDTGSTDGTKAVIERVMREAGIVGEVFDRPWVNFAHNRTEALELCRGRMDWAIMLDADDNLAGAVPSQSLWTADVDAFAMRMKHEQIWHNRTQIFRVASDWAYRGVVHEQPFCRTNDAPRIAMLPTEIYMETRCAGVRSRDPHKYEKDAALLEAEWIRNPADGRTLFYLAQSYRDASKMREAEHYYTKVLDISGISVHERYMSYVNLITMVAEPAKQLEYAWAAFELHPKRVEAPFALMRRHRLEARPVTQQLYALAAAANNRKFEIEWPYVNPDVYGWGYDDEFAVVAFSTGHYKEAYDATIQILVNCQTSETRESAAKNARVCKAKLMTDARLQ